MVGAKRLELLHLAALEPKSRMNESSGFYFALDIIFQLHGRG